jgi:sulfite exporter TauE/SafE
MALQAHWPLDVLAGACVGWWVGSLAYLLSELAQSEGARRVHQIVASIVLAAASLYLWQHATQDMPSRQMPFIAAASVWLFLLFAAVKSLWQGQTADN